LNSFVQVIPLVTFDNHNSASEQKGYKLVAAKYILEISVHFSLRIAHL